MTETPHRPDDPYSRVNYRRLIAWEPRITREAPFLLSLLDRAPDRSVIDLGCGTGEHVAFFADADVRAVGTIAFASNFLGGEDQVTPSCRGPRMGCGPGQRQGGHSGN